MYLQGVQALHLEIAVRMDSSTFLYFVFINRFSGAREAIILSKMEKKAYETPVVEQLECMVEKGFAGSNNMPSEDNNATEGLYDFEGGEFQFN